MHKGSKFLVAAALATVGAGDLLIDTAAAAPIAGFSFDGKTLFGGTTLTSSVMGTGYIAEVGTGTMYGAHSVTNSVWSYPVGNGTTSSMSATGWTTGDSYYEFEVPTADFQDILVQFDQVSSSTGPRNWKLQYKVGVGGTYFDFANYNLLPNGNSGTIVNPAWVSSSANPNTVYTFDLSAVNVIEGVSGDNVFFRLLVDGTQQAGSGATAFPTGGTSRIDNVLVSGSPIPEPAAAGLLTAAASAALLRRRQRA